MGERPKYHTRVKLLLDVNVIVMCMYVPQLQRPAPLDKDVAQHPGLCHRHGPAQREQRSLKEGGRV